MKKIKILIVLFLCSGGTVSGVKIRLFSNQAPESVIFSVDRGKYKMYPFLGESRVITRGDAIIVSRYKGKLAVKIRGSLAFISDSVVFSGQTGNDSFSLRINGILPLRQDYSGDLQCLPDLNTIVLINKCDEEKYVTGVVRAEGGIGKNIEYFKSQAVIARTYMYKYIDKHKPDGYNLCDNTHCQAFNGSSTDSILNMATMETKGQVILDHDSTLIISSFHSNCGGETSPAEFVWLTSQPYLKKVIDPYCSGSRNAGWQKSISSIEWLRLIQKHGFSGKSDDYEQFRFAHSSRVADYKTGSYTIPLRIIRNELNLRSTFFSAIPEGDSIILMGRGYGHGVGLCQEGAMIMATKGFNYRQIINFYYSGVIIMDVRNALNLSQK